MFDFKPGDIVRLTGEGWRKYGFRGQIDEVIGRDEVGPKIKSKHDDGQHYRIVNNGQFGDFSAELVEAAPLAPRRDADLNDGVPDKVTFTINPDGATDVNPPHYGFPDGVQVIDITKHLDFLSGNVVKYVCRAGRKGDRLTDLKKAKQYLDWLIEREDNNE